jgi:hypothetical protein
LWGGRKEARNKIEEKSLHQRVDYFIQNLIFHNFIKKKRGYVREREREREGEETIY